MPRKRLFTGSKPLFVVLPGRVWTGANNGGNRPIPGNCAPAVPDLARGQDSILSPAGIEGLHRVKRHVSHRQETPFMRGVRSSDWRPYQELCGTSDRQPLETCSRPQWQRISSPCAGPVLVQGPVITLNKPATGPGIQILLHFRRGFGLRTGKPAIRVMCKPPPQGTLSSAWLTSAMMSSMFSIPTDIRTRSGLTPAAANSSAFNCL